MTRTRWLGLGLGVLVLALAVWGAVEVAEGRDDIPQEAVLGEGSGFAPYLPGARDATADTCTDVPCRWAVTSDTADLLMFETEEQAQQFTEEHEGDVRRSGWIAVVLAPDTLTPQQQDELVAALDGLHTSD